MPEKVVVIVAGGTGSRMKSDKPKQFLALNGLPVIIHTLKKFLDFDASVQLIVVVHKDYLEHLRNSLTQHLPAATVRLTEGGATRFDSVYNGLKMIKDPDAIVAIHDAARPLVSVETIRLCFETAALKGNAIPSVPVSESLRHVAGTENKAVNREDYRVIQTPQCFRYADIFNAFSKPYQSSFTDDATVLEASGQKINLVEGNLENIKITSPHDLLLAAALLKTNENK
jgi:2-C-methyl-D-erythritol 4-phosphate cytidylyltransferase